MRSPAAALLLVPVLLAGCGGGSASTPSASASTTASTSTTASPSAPEPTASQTPEPAATVVALPQSALRTVKGATYRVIGTDEVPQSLRDRTDVLEGIVTRALVRQGGVVGTVQLVRFSADLEAADLLQGQRAFVQEYVAGAATTRSTVAGRTALVAKNVRDNLLGVVAVLDGRDLVLFTGPDVANARFVAGRYFA